MSDKRLTPEEKWERATLANNFIFYKVMRHHPEACKHLLEMLLKIKIKKMEMHNEEAMEKALAEYGKYQVKTLSPVEQAYLESVKMIENEVKRKK